MSRVCSKCEFVNQDDYDFCAKCGNPLIEGLKPNNVIFYTAQPMINKKAIAISYFVTIFLSWSGFVVGLITKSTSATFFTFFGFFIPFYLVQSPIREIRKHGFIQLLISLAGIFLSFYIFLR